MRLLVLSNRYPPDVAGGYERRCAATVAGLAERHEVLVLTSGMVTATGSEIGIAPVIRELPSTTTGLRGAMQAPVVAGPSAQLARAIHKAFKPDLVYVWNGVTIPHVALRALELTGTPVAYSVAEHWYSYLYRTDHFTRYLVGDKLPASARLWSHAIRAINTRGRVHTSFDVRTRVAVCWNSQTLRRLSTPPREHEVVVERVVYPASQSEGVFRSVDRTTDAARDPVIVFTGRLAPEKGIDIAVDALAQVRAEHAPGARLVVCGTGSREYQRELQRLVARRNLTDVVAFVGAQSHEQLAERYRTAAAVVVPSRWDEPYGLACLEAALAGVPVVASESGGLTEILDRDSEALFFAKGDVDSCASALAQVIRDPDAARRRADAARARATRVGFDAYLDAQHEFVSAAHAALT